jgi:hypothetical protein
MMTDPKRLKNYAVGTKHSEGCAYGTSRNICKLTGVDGLIHISKNLDKEFKVGDSLEVFVEMIA